MLIDYINQNYENAEPIFLSELPYSSKAALRQEMKKLTDEGKLIRLYNGVFYKPYKTIFNNTFFETKNLDWWKGLYSKTTFYRLREHAIKEFLGAYENL